LHRLPTKLVAKYTEGTFLLCLEGEKENMELKKPMWGWGNSAVL
jgi:hypothetical protein